MRRDATPSIHVAKKRFCSSNDLSWYNQVFDTLVGPTAIRTDVKILKLEVVKQRLKSSTLTGSHLEIIKCS